MKEKSLYHLQLAEVKNHLRLDGVSTTISGYTTDSGYTADDLYINDIIKISVQIAEDYIGKDVALTQNTLVIDDFSGDFVEIQEGNLISITSIIDADGNSYTGKTIEIDNDSFTIILDRNVSNSDLTIVFQTGYESNKLPLPIKQAILIKIADLYDTDRTSYLAGGYKDSGIFEKLLNNYKVYSYKHINN